MGKKPESDVIRLLPYLSVYTRVNTDNFFYFSAMEHTQKQCLSCGKPLKGRIDKKFCDDYCRTQYNNQLKAEDSAVIKKINAILRQNRRLLERIIAPGEEMGKCPKQKLLDGGYNFQYMTHQYTNKKGNVYSFCYEYGFLPLEGDWMLVVKRQQL